MRLLAKIRATDVALLLVAALVTLLYVLVGGGGFPLDDSWIHQTYGRNLAAAGIWAFVPGVPSAASTSPLYTVILAIGYWLRIPVLIWTHGLGALALGLTGIIGSRLAERAAPEIRGIGFITGLALVFAWHLVWAAASGMETMIFSMLTLLLIWLAWRETDAENGRTALRGAIFGLAAALTTLARPEGVLLAGMAGLLLLIFRFNWRWLLAWGGAAGAAFLLLLAPYLIFNLRITGGLLPNTAAAKQMWVRGTGLYEISYLWRFWNLTITLMAGGQFLLIPGMVTFVIVLLRRVRGQRELLLHLLPPLWGIALIGLYSAWLPLPFQHGRYIIPALPALILSGVVGTVWMLQWARASLPGRVLTRSIAASAALMFIVFILTIGLQAYRQDVAIIDQEMVNPAHWIVENIPPDEPLAVHDIGAVGYYARRPILDIAGLVSPEFIPTILEPDAMWALLEDRGARYLMAMPDQVPGDDTGDPRLCPLYQSEGTAALTAGGEKMTVYALAWDRDCG
jgi:hypothetical protein